MLLARLLPALALLAIGCGVAQSNRPTMLIGAASGSAVAAEEALAGCRVWSDYADCSVSTQPNIIVSTAPTAGSDDAYAVTTGESMVIDAAALDAAGIGRVFALAHEFGHRLGIVMHPPEPAALMSATAAGTWGKAELSQSDRDAIEAVLSAAAEYDSLKKL